MGVTQFSFVFIVVAIVGGGLEPAAIPIIIPPARRRSRNRLSPVLTASPSPSWAEDPPAVETQPRPRGRPRRKSVRLPGAAASNAVEKYWCCVCETRLTEEASFVTCTGPCHQSFHVTCLPQEPARRSSSWQCSECSSHQHRCFCCGKLSPDADLRHCCVRACGKFYHSLCWADAGGSTSKAACVRHQCQRCVKLGLPMEERNPEPVQRCIRCPKAWDLSCMPKGCFRLDFRPPHFIICPDHTPLANAVRLPSSFDKRDPPLAELTDDDDGNSTVIPFDLPDDWRSEATPSPIPPLPTEGSSRIAKEAVPSDALSTLNPSISDTAAADDHITGPISSKRKAKPDPSANQCRFCQETFKWSHIRNVHEREKHPELCPLHCPTCNAPFHTQAPLDRHIQNNCGRGDREKDDDEESHQSEAPPTTKLRPRRSSVIIPEEPPPIVCDHCDKTFHQTNALRIHERQHHPEHCPLQCHRCGAGFHSQAPLERHILECLAPEPEPMEIEEDFTPKRPYHPPEPMACSVCSKPFTSAAAIEKHLLSCSKRSVGLSSGSVQRASGSAIVVRLPGFRKEHPGYFRSQQSTAVTPPPPSPIITTTTPSTPAAKIVCNLCHEQFSSKYLLHKHQRDLHSDTMPFFCSNCQTRFSGRSSMETHTSQCGDYVCEECGREFFSRTSLDRHARQTGHKTGPVVDPIICPVCQKQFKWQRSLDNHLIRLHAQSDGIRKSSRSDAAAGVDTKPDIDEDEEYVEIADNEYVCPKPILTPPSLPCCSSCSDCADESCHLRKDRIECALGCSDTCRNQRIRCREFVGDVHVHDGALQVARAVRAGDFLGEFVGEILDANARRARLITTLEPVMFRITPHLTVDATHRGNLGRYLGLSDAANCVLVPWISEGAHHLMIMALGDIEPGAVLTVEPIASQRVAYDNVVKRVKSGKPAAAPCPLEAYDREKLPSQMQFDLVMNYQLEVPDSHADEAKADGIYLTRTWRRCYEIRVAQAKVHTELGQTIDIAANLATYERLNKQRNRRSIASSDIIRPPANASPVRTPRPPDARVVMPAVSLIPLRKRRCYDESSSDESSFDAGLSESLARDVDVSLRHLRVSSDDDIEAVVIMVDDEVESESLALEIDDDIDEDIELPPRLEPPYVPPISLPTPANTSTPVIREALAYIDTANDGFSNTSAAITPRSEGDENQPTPPPDRFQCVQCDMRFSQKNLLKKHLITHGDDNPFKCETCQLPFLRASDLQRHMTVKKHGTPQKVLLQQQKEQQKELQQQQQQQLIPLSIMPDDPLSNAVPNLPDVTV